MRGTNIFIFAISASRLKYVFPESELLGLSSFYSFPLGFGAFVEVSFIDGMLFGLLIEGLFVSSLFLVTGTSLLLRPVCLCTSMIAS